MVSNIYVYVSAYVFFSHTPGLFFASVSPKTTTCLGSALAYVEVTGGAGTRCAGQCLWHVQIWVGFSGWMSGQKIITFSFKKHVVRVPEVP